MCKTERRVRCWSVNTGFVISPLILEVDIANTPAPGIEGSFVQWVHMGSTGVVINSE